MDNVLFLTKPSIHYCVPLVMCMGMALKDFCL